MGRPHSLALTGVVGHQLLQAAELGAGGDVEAATVQFTYLIVLHVEALGVVEVGHRQAVGTYGASVRGDHGPQAPGDPNAMGGGSSF